MPAARRGAITGASINGNNLFNTSSNTNTTNNNQTTNMATGFAFGTTPAAAPTAPGATPGFSFGTPSAATPAAAPSTGFSFSGTSAPTTGTTSAFGTTPGTSAFGGTFGNAPTPAGSSSLFSATAPGTTTNLFGGTPAPSTGMFGQANTSFFGGASQPAAPLGQQPAATPIVPALAGRTKYSELPPDQKQMIDALYQTIMQHKRTILQVSTMQPKLLANNTQQADLAAGQADLPLKATVRQLDVQVQQLQHMEESLREGINYTKGLYQKSSTQAYFFASWPTEAVAVRRGVQLTKRKTVPDQNTLAELRVLLDQQMAHVDRVERMPSPYLWQVLEEMEQRLLGLNQQMASFQSALEQSKKIRTDDVDVTRIVQQHEMVIYKYADAIARLHEKVEELRRLYRRTETGRDVLLEADQEENERKRQIDQQVLLQMVKTLPTTTATAPPAQPGGGLFGGTTAQPTSLFGAAAPKPGGSLFGGTPAPGSSLFGGTPTPAFGTTPAPASAGGSLFGNPTTQAPAPFGAPAPGTNLFGAAPSFGTPGPAPAAGGSLFGNTGTSTSTTPKSNNKKSGGRRRR